MKKINATLKSVTFLLLVMLMSACNKDGMETIVIEDGQPSVAQMIVGTWNPERGEIADEAGNVNETISPDDMGGLDFGEEGTVETGGGMHTPGGMYEGGSSDWSADEGNPQNPGINGDTGGGIGYDGEGPSVNIGGERWYIFQLTGRILIIYRIYDGYIIIYYYYRAGEYTEPEPSPEPEPGAALVSEIRATTTYASGDKITTVYRFSYDDRNRIQHYSITGANYTNEWSYRYNEEEEVYVTGDESYKVYRDRIGIRELYSLSADGSSQKLVASPVYDENGYMQTLNNNSFEYQNGNLVLLNSRGFISKYEYSTEENNANIDLNCIVSDCSAYEYDYSHYSLFAPFGFYGKRSANMISIENMDDADMYYVYAYERNAQGQIGVITRKCMNKWQEDDVLDMTVFKVSYQ